MTRSRRLAALLLGLCLGVEAPTAAVLAAPGAAEPPRVVLVILGGGVGATELLGRPDLLPTVRAIGAAGFSSSGWAAGGADPASATAAILTGRAESGVAPGRSRPVWPTILEYARKGLSLPAEGVWYASYADGDALDLAWSDHAEHGAPFAPRLAYGEGPFGEALHGLFHLFGRPNPTKERTWGLLAGLRRAGREEAARRTGSFPGDDVEEMRVERALLEDVERRATEIGGPAGLDARAVRAGIGVLKVFRPRLLVVRLGQADAARSDVKRYEEVLRRDDAELARLRATIAGDPALAGSTALLVATDLGRSDASSDRTTTAVIGEGRGLVRGAPPSRRRDARDLCPTIGRLLGVPTPYAEGAVREELLAR